MRFVTFSRDGNARLGLVAGDHVVDLNLADPDLPSDMVTFLAAGSEALEAVSRVHQRWAEAEGRLDPNALLPRAESDLLAPIQNPSKIIAAGVNYLDHCREAGIEPPKEPVLFAKFPSSIAGPGEVIEWDPALTAEVDYEAELAVVIGCRARNVPPAAALDIVFGYTCANDVTARDLQARDGQWVRGKSLDTFCPLGPEIVTKDEVPHPGRLGIACRVNGEPVQASNTAEMIFDIPALIAFITRSFTLMPGDLILTGTPHGTGAFRQPPILLHDGDIVEVEVEGIGLLRSPCRERSSVSAQAR
jgi:2-keto-4-pentenoate hydratase/2-oxohepta-3-ene-1,7-dioic acid hydratase in catechol pathway